MFHGMSLEIKMGVFDGTVSHSLHFPPPPSLSLFTSFHKILTFTELFTQFVTKLFLQSFYSLIYFFSLQL